MNLFGLIELSYAVLVLRINQDFYESLKIVTDAIEALQLYSKQG
jgi:hypothetical protein